MTKGATWCGTYARAEGLSVFENVHGLTVVFRYKRCVWVCESRRQIRKFSPSSPEELGATIFGGFFFFGKFLRGEPIFAGRPNRVCW